MAIVTTDLVAYGSASRPETDSATSGGAIDVLHRPAFAQLAASGTLQFKSTSASDTQSVTITGRNASGAVVTETFSLTGTTQKNGSTSFERIQKVVLASNAVGTISVKQSSVTFATIPVDERGFYAMFLNSASGAAPTVRYEKFFWYNKHASLTLNSAIIKLSSDPSSKIKIGLATAKNDSGSVSNRLTAPASVTFVDDNVDQNVPGSTLESSTGIGVWVQQTLSANDAPLKSTFATDLRGTTT